MNRQTYWTQFFIDDQPRFVKIGPVISEMWEVDIFSNDSHI